MSHVAEVKMAVRDLDMLEEAAAACGLELVRGQRTFRWYGQFLNDWSDTERAAIFQGRDPKQFGKCEHALRLKGAPGSYEIGLVPRLNGEPGWDVLYDAWGAGGARLEAAAGKQLVMLQEHYGAAITARHLIRKGHKAVRKVITETGHVQVRAMV